MVDYPEPMCNCVGCQVKELGEQVHNRLNGNAQDHENLVMLINRVNEMTAIDKVAVVERNTAESPYPNRYPGGKY